MYRKVYFEQHGFSMDLSQYKIPHIPLKESLSKTYIPAATFLWKSHEIPYIPAKKFCFGSFCAFTISKCTNHMRRKQYSCVERFLVCRVGWPLYKEKHKNEVNLPWFQVIAFSIINATKISSFSTKGKSCGLSLFCRKSVDSLSAESVTGLFKLAILEYVYKSFLKFSKCFTVIGTYQCGLNFQREWNLASAMEEGHLIELFQLSLAGPFHSKISSFYKVAT